MDEKAGDVIVRFPWKSDEKNFDPETAIQELGEMAELTFRGPDNTVYIKGSDVSRSQVAVDQQKNYVVELEFSSEGAKKFADATEKLVGQQMGIYMDDDLISNPTVNAKITGGKAEITGMSSKEEAQSLSDKINSGSLPFSMKTTNYSTISPTLGGKALNAMAGAEYEPLSVDVNLSNTLQPVGYITRKLKRLITLWWITRSRIMQAVWSFCWTSIPT